MQILQTGLSLVILQSYPHVCIYCCNATLSVGGYTGVTVV